MNRYDAWKLWPAEAVAMIEELKADNLNLVNSLEQEGYRVERLQYALITIEEKILELQGQIDALKKVDEND
jgi:hypothetical protein